MGAASPAPAGRNRAVRPITAPTATPERPRWARGRLGGRKGAAAPARSSAPSIHGAAATATNPAMEPPATDCAAKGITA